MTVTCNTDVPPPDGAEGDIWEQSTNPAAIGITTQRHRVVFTVPRCVLNSTGDPLCSPIVTAQAVQWESGALDIAGLVEPPTVSVECDGAQGLTINQARELALCILHAVFQIEGWLAR